MVWTISLYEGWLEEMVRGATVATIPSACCASSASWPI
jgi:hypothetical protein